MFPNWSHSHFFTLWFAFRVNTPPPPRAELLPGGLPLRPSGLLSEPAEGGGAAPRPPPHGPHHHVAIGAAAGHLLGGQAAMDSGGARLWGALLGGPLQGGLGLLLGWGGPAAQLLLVLTHRQVVVAVGAQQHPRSCQRGRRLLAPGGTPAPLGVGGGLTERHCGRSTESD